MFCFQGSCIVMVCDNTHNIPKQSAHSSCWCPTLSMMLRSSTVTCSRTSTKASFLDNRLVVGSQSEGFCSCWSWTGRCFHLCLAFCFWLVNSHPIRMSNSTACCVAYEVEIILMSQQCRHATHHVLLRPSADPGSSSALLPKHWSLWRLGRWGMCRDRWP